MTKTEKFLDACMRNLGDWTCAYCASDSNQPAAVFREAKKLGYEFEETSPNRWGKRSVCPKCGTYRTHYKLIALEPIFHKKERIAINDSTRKRILSLLDMTDAFSGASISSTPEIDHKVPWTRLDNDIDASSLSDDEIKRHFQLLTREHNLLKDRMCGHCKINNIRPPFFGLHFWYEGDEHYLGTCVGCGWYDGAKWKEELNKVLNEDDNLSITESLHRL